MLNDENFTFIGEKEVVIEILETYLKKSVVLPFDYRNSNEKVWMMARIGEDLLIQRPINTWDVNMLNLVDDNISLPNDKEIKEGADV